MKQQEKKAEEDSKKEAEKKTKESEAEADAAKKKAEKDAAATQKKAEGEAAAAKKKAADETAAKKAEEEKSKKKTDSLESTVARIANHVEKLTKDCGKDGPCAGNISELKSATADLSTKIGGKK